VPCKFNHLKAQKPGLSSFSVTQTHAQGKKLFDQTNTDPEFFILENISEPRHLHFPSDSNWKLNKSSLRGYLSEVNNNNFSTLWKYIFIAKSFKQDFINETEDSYFLHKIIFLSRKMLAIIFYYCLSFHVRGSFLVWKGGQSWNVFKKLSSILGIPLCASLIG